LVLQSIVSLEIIGSITSIESGIETKCAVISKIYERS